MICHFFCEFLPIRYTFSSSIKKIRQFHSPRRIVYIFKKFGKFTETLITVYIKVLLSPKIFFKINIILKYFLDFPKIGKTVFDESIKTFFEVGFSSFLDFRKI